MHSARHNGFQRSYPNLREICYVEYTGELRASGFAIGLLVLTIAVGIENLGTPYLPRVGIWPQREGSGPGVLPRPPHASARVDSNQPRFQTLYAEPNRKRCKSAANVHGIAL